MTTWINAPAGPNLTLIRHKALGANVFTGRYCVIVVTPFSRVMYGDLVHEGSKV